MGQIQLIQITLDELGKIIDDKVKLNVEDLKTNFQPKEPTEFMTRNQVAELLSIDLSTLHKWTVKGRLKAVGIGRRVYYKRSEVEAALTELR